MRLFIWFLVVWFQQDEGHVKYRGAHVAAPDGQVVVTLGFQIEEGFHIQHFAPENPNLLPTRIEIELPEGWQLLNVEFPEGAPFFMGNEEQPLMVYSGVLDIRISVRPSDVHFNERRITGILHYQSCDNVKCYFPRSLSFAIDL